MYLPTVLAIVASLPLSVSKDENLFRFSLVIKPTVTELKWQQIPWTSDLTEGLQQAQTEKRPIFLWVTGDDPLERC